MELRIEKEMEVMLMTWRDEEGFTTLYDNQLGIILQVLHCKIDIVIMIV